MMRGSLGQLIELARNSVGYAGNLDELAGAVLDVFAEDQPCSMPEPKALPGIGKIEIPEDAAGLWDIDDAQAFAIMILKRCDDARKGG